jgi:RNA polymerase sigma factor (sigma-70 family)
VEYKTLEQVRHPDFEPLFQTIRDNPNEVWAMFSDIIYIKCSKLAAEKNMELNELFNIAYINFIDLCKRYDPYYNDGFYQFDRYMYWNLDTLLRANIQRYYVKSKREQCTEDGSLLNRQESSITYSKFETSSDIDFNIDLNKIKKMLPYQYGEVLELTIEGYGQEKIARMLGMTQPRVYKMLTYMKLAIFDKYDAKSKTCIKINEAMKLLKHYMEQDTIDKQHDKYDNKQELNKQRKEIRGDYPHKGKKRNKQL